MFIFVRFSGKVIGNRYGPGTGPVLLADVYCVGNETSIGDCYYSGLVNSDCDHSEDASVSCATSHVQYGKSILLASLCDYFNTA